MKKSIIKKNILVTGGYGTLGCHLVNFLSNDINNNIYLLDRNSKSKKLLSLNIPRKIKIINGNFNKYKSLLSIIKNKKINIIFHLGAITQVINAYKSPIKTFRTNIIGTINILEAVRKINKNIIIIYSSSDKAYGEMNKSHYTENSRLHGEFPYDVSKSSSDLICQTYSKTYGLKIGIIRSGNIYGPGDFNLDRLVPGLLVSIIKNKNIKIRSNGRLRRDYLYVDDVAKGYISLMKKMIKDSRKLFIYNLGSRYNFNAIELVEKVYKILNIKKLKPVIQNKFTKIEIKNQKLNYKKASKELNWLPKTSFENGIQKSFSWYNNNAGLF